MSSGRKKFLLPSPWSARLGVAVIGVACAWPLMAQDEDEDLPDEPSADAQALTESDDEGGEMPEVEGGDPATAATSVPEEPAGPTWESYNSETSESIAQEVTKGVRVEDIVEPPTDYRYAAFGKADPFVPPLVTRDAALAAAAPGVDPLEIPIVSPLQRFALADLTVVGIWQLTTGERKAMIIGRNEGNAAAQGIIVKNGDPVGNRGGKILGIGDTYVTVREFTLAPDGTRQYEDQQLFMGDQGEDLTGKIRFTPGQAKTEVLLNGAEGAAQPPVAALQNVVPAAATGPAALTPPGTNAATPGVPGAPAAQGAAGAAIGAAEPTVALPAAGAQPGAATQPFVNPLVSSLNIDKPAASTQAQPAVPAATAQPQAPATANPIAQPPGS